ncbi:protein-disulfide reductase DsbD family protein [Gammaproteobacteria bacterium]|nr:protein-disulfide reductase DsbD family protein [Gammaproteobacteria bacterium]
MKLSKIFLLFLFVVNINANSVNSGHAEISLIKYNQSELSNDKNLIGIKMDMQKNWHTYWKNPGDSGGPIKIIWKTSENISIGQIKWPTPELIPYDPLMTYGYKDFVIFPFEYVKNFDGNADIELDLDFLICDDICIPEKAKIQTTLNEIKEDIKLVEWNNKVPSTKLPVLSDVEKGFLELRFSFNDPIESIVFFIENENTVDHPAEQILIKEENNWLLKVPLLENINSINIVSGLISINENQNFIIDSGIEIQESNSSLSLIQAIIFAFIGGLILNLMPCVFPVISLKVLSFVSMGNESVAKIRIHSLSFCVGVLISFIAMGLALIILKQIGNNLGWGFQLQSPIIVGYLSILMFVIGIILLTDINIGSSLTRLDNKSNNSYLSSFLTGVLAVIVASPCTAPLMAPALGYALVQPDGLTMPVFVSLGLGFAFPYLILSMNPKLINVMPKPGQWMETLKEFFAFPMFATSLWLIWVFAKQTDTDMLIGLLVTILLISLILWFINKSNNKNLNLIYLLLLAIIIIFEGKNILDYEYPSNKNMNNMENVSYTIWDPEIETRYKNSNQAYLINFTAAWCITCQANDKIALSRPKIKKYFKDNNVEYIVADWTNKDNEILESLESYSRNGVPLYIYWKPGMDESKILPAILTEQILLDNF